MLVLEVRQPQGDEDQHERAAVREAGLAQELFGEFAGRQAGAGEERQLLPLDQGVEGVDGGNPGLDELFGMCPGHRVDGDAADRQAALGDEHRQAVPRAEGAVEDPSQAAVADRGPPHRIAEGHAGGGGVKPEGLAKHLDHHGLPVDFQDFAVDPPAVGGDDRHRFAEPRGKDLLEKEQRAADGGDRAVAILSQAHRVPPCSSARRNDSPAARRAARRS